MKGKGSNIEDHSIYRLPRGTRIAAVNAEEVWKYTPRGPETSIAIATRDLVKREASEIFHGIQKYRTQR
jgi:hypothetical protein